MCYHIIAEAMALLEGRFEPLSPWGIPGEHGVPVGKGEGVGPVSKTEIILLRFQLHPPRSAAERIDILLIEVSSLSRFPTGLQKAYKIIYRKPTQPPDVLGSFTNPADIVTPPFKDTCHFF